MIMMEETSQNFNPLVKLYLQSMTPGTTNRVAPAQQGSGIVVQRLLQTSAAATAKRGGYLCDVSGSPELQCWVYAALVRNEKYVRRRTWQNHTCLR